MRDDTRDRADAVREQILREARDLFAHFGFNKTNIGDIAEQANMSPNLSTKHFGANKRLYEQVLYNTFSLVGIASPVQSEHTNQLCV